MQTCNDCKWLAMWEPPTFGPNYRIWRGPVCRLTGKRTNCTVGACKRFEPRATGRDIPKWPEPPIEPTRGEDGVGT